MVINPQKILDNYLKIAVIILLFSAFMDYLLWFTIRYHVPCWTIATISLFIAIILEVLRRKIRKKA